MSDTGRVTTRLNRITWAALAAVFAAVGVSAFTLPYGPTRNLVDMIDGFAIAAVALGLRMAARRSPSRQLLTRMLPFATAATAVTCGWAALTQSGQPFVVIAAMATGVAAYDFGLATACVITATGVVAVDVGGLAYRVDAWGLLGVPLLMILGLLIGRLILGYRVQAEQSAALLAKAEQVRLEQRRTAALDERNRIAREIHDVLAHSLGSLGVQIQAARAVLTDRGDIDQAVDLLGRAQRSAAEGLTETRRALQALRSDTPPLAGALDELGADHRRRYETPVTVEVTGRARPTPPWRSPAPPKSPWSTPPSTRHTSRSSFDLTSATARRRSRSSTPPLTRRLSAQGWRRSTAATGSRACESGSSSSAALSTPVPATATGSSPPRSRNDQPADATADHRCG